MPAGKPEVWLPTLLQAACASWPMAGRCGVGPEGVGVEGSVARRCKAALVFVPAGLHAWARRV